MTDHLIENIAYILPLLIYPPIIILLVLFLYFRVNLLAWVTVAGLSSIFYSLSNYFGYAENFFILFLITFFMLIRPLRLFLLSRPLLLLIQKIGIVPSISQTERTALVSGTAWMDKELFSGSPDVAKLRSVAFHPLNKQEKDFLDKEVERVCELTDDWAVFQKRDLSDAVWKYLKAKKFFGMIIPKKYGGLGFSATAHAAVIEKLASRSYPLGVTVMVPNSLGPAELLLHYGTQRQRDYYLPRLAKGQEIPCFGLTEPEAGSDAGSIESYGVVQREKNGKIVITLTWRKRYITLAAVSTVIGLAFQLKDPKNILGKGKHPGITCALIPAKTTGVKLGRRHDPLNVPFYNCPVEGKNVKIGIDAIIGEENGVGQGWKMLMESLAAGRGISLPSTATGSAKLLSRVVGTYSTVRQQFGNPLYRFEGVQEPLARIAGFTYMLDAVRGYTLSGLDAGQRPPVISAICKYHFTEIGRMITNEGMDIMAGAAISRGPRNLLAHTYFAIPISITVEGANILTRSFIIFGQGAMRCHPYMMKEVDALQNGDVKQFDANFYRHIAHVLQNFARYVLLSLTRGWFSLPTALSTNGKYWRKIVWTSAAFAFWADFTLGVLGGTFKRRERVSAQLGDILSWMYFLSATLNHYENAKRPEDKPLLEWSMAHGFSEIERAWKSYFNTIFSVKSVWLFPLRIVSFLLRLTVVVNSTSKELDDHKMREVVDKITTNKRSQLHLTKGIYVPTKKNEALARLENAQRLVFETQDAYKKMKQGLKKRGIKLKGEGLQESIKMATEAKLISAKEAKAIVAAEKARTDAVEVDVFTLSDYAKHSVKTAKLF